MKIKMRVHFAGPDFSAAPGDEIEREDSEAIRLIDKGYAVPMAALPVEHAVQAQAPEVRVAKSQFKGKRR